MVVTGRTLPTKIMSMRKDAETYENLPDSFQNGERGEEMQGYLEMLDGTYNDLDDANSVIDQI